MGAHRSQLLFSPRKTPKPIGGQTKANENPLPPFLFAGLLQVRILPGSRKINQRKADEMAQAVNVPQLRLLKGSEMEECTFFGDVSCENEAMWKITNPVLPQSELFSCYRHLSIQCVAAQAGYPSDEINLVRVNHGFTPGGV